MEDGFFDLIEFLKKPTVVVTFVDILLCAVPIWLAVMIGLVIGWSWRPRWTSLLYLGLRSKLRFLWTIPPGLGARRLWLACTALSAFSVGRRLWFNRKENSKQALAVETDTSAEGSGAGVISPFTRDPEQENGIITSSDLDHLWHLIEGNVRDMTWRNIMAHSTTNFYYEAWHHEPEMGPTMYRSRTVFEDVSPELVRDFFWDDEFRPKWDPMLSYMNILDECPRTGTMIVHWIRKFPFFCSDREYIIGRRIWEAGKSYYCVTKGIPYPGLQRGAKPRRVDLYFSSWSIKAVQSRKGGERLCATEVSLIHYEDMGIPKDIAKIGVRHGMWGAVKKLHSGLRAYQSSRKREAPLSRCALIATRTTPVSFNNSIVASEIVLREEDEDDNDNDKDNEDEEEDFTTVMLPGNGIDWKWVVIGGVIMVFCGVHTSKKFGRR